MVCRVQKPPASASWGSIVRAVMLLQNLGTDGRRATRRAPAPHLRQKPRLHALFLRIIGPPSDRNVTGRGEKCGWLRVRDVAPTAAALWPVPLTVRGTFSNHVCRRSACRCARATRRFAGDGRASRARRRILARSELMSNAATPRPPVAALLGTCAIAARHSATRTRLARADKPKPRLVLLLEPSKGGDAARIVF